jgi:uncharacterized protein YjbJ (UPF0337 family)
MGRKIEDYEKENPNVRQQNDEWRKERVARGQDPNDAEAFRQHEQAIGAPDPGAEAIKDPQGAAKREREGVKEEVAGTLKSAAGKFLRNEGLAAEGESERKSGQTSRKAD